MSISTLSRSRVRNVPLRTLILLSIVTLLFHLASGPGGAWAEGRVHQRERIEAAISERGYAKVVVSLRTESSGTAVRRAVDGVASAAGDEEQASLVGSATKGISSMLEGVSHKVRHRFGILPFLALDVSEGALAVLEKHPAVLKITEDRLRPVGDGVRTDLSVETTLSGMWSVTAAPQLYPQNLDFIGATQAWSQGYTGQGLYVAVIDSGVLAGHELFAGKSVVEACFSRDGDCPNGSTEMFGPGAARPHDRIYDGYEHGTHVAGIAVGNSGRSFGVARDANLIAVQVFSRFNPAACGGVPCLLSYDSDQLRALEYVYSIRSNYGIASVNMSLGGGDYTNQSFCDLDPDNARMKVAIDRLREARIPTIISAGNSGSCSSLEAPACISSAVAVGAVDDTDTELTFNNWHYGMLDLLAPGRFIYSAIPDTTTSYTSLSGTSMAAPHVAGAWAIQKQKNRGASVSEILDAFTSTGVPVRTLCLSIDDYKPRVQVNGALAPDPVPVPADVRNAFYAATASPVLNPSRLMPIGVGSVAGSGDSVDIQVGFYKFSETVDIYLGIFAAAIDPDNIYLVIPGNGVRPLSTGLIPWKSGIAGPVDESLFGELPVISFPPGLYTLYVAVTPAQRTDRYTIWSTDFSVP